MSTHGPSRPWCRWLPVAAAAVALTGLPARATVAQNVSDTIDAYVGRWHAIGRFSGVVLVARDAEILYQRGFGLANVPWAVENTPDTRFDIGSIAKQFTTVLTLQLVAEGRLALDKTLTDYLPDYRPDTGRRITIDQLLRHTSGLPDFLRDFEPAPVGPDRFPLEQTFERARFVKDHLSPALLFEPGSRYHYSSSGYCLLALVIEQVTGRSFADTLRTRILEPLGLKNTGLLSPFEAVPGMATGYVRTPLGLRNARYYDQRTLRGAGGMYSSAGDLLTWNRALRAGTLLSPAMTNRLLTPYWKEGGAIEHAYSLSYFSTRLGEAGDTIRYTSFNGAIEGFCSDVFGFADTGLFVVILDNSDELNHWRMAPDIYRIVRGLPYAMPKPRAADAVARAALAGGPDAARRALAEVRGAGADEYESGNVEAGLNGIGATLLQKGEPGAAATILELSLTLNPDSATAHRRLAGALAAQGHDAQAVEHRERARQIAETEATLMTLLTTRQFTRAEAFVKEVRHARPDARLLVPGRVGPLFEEVFASGNDADAIALTGVWALANPGEAGAYFSRARVHLRAGDTARAIACYQQVIEMDPTGPSAASARRAIERVRRDGGSGADRPRAPGA